MFSPWNALFVHHVVLGPIIVIATGILQGLGFDLGFRVSLKFLVALHATSSSSTRLSGFTLDVCFRAENRNFMRNSDHTCVERKVASSDNKAYR